MPDTSEGWPALPTETEIYILPNGEIVVADLPAELAATLQHLAPAAHARAAREHAVESDDPAREPEPHDVAD